MKDALFLRDEQIKDIIELILFAYRDTFLDSKNILKKHSYGTAHHKALHLIEKHNIPALTVYDELIVPKSKVAIAREAMYTLVDDAIYKKYSLMDQIKNL